MKIWLALVSLLILSGCANTTWQELSDCRKVNLVALVPVLNDDGSVFKTIDGKPVMKTEGVCKAEYAAYQKHMDAKERRAVKRAPKCPDGSIWYCYRKSCGCARNDDVRDVVRRMGY
ncbi:hypothetical protein LCGC14_2167880 [marine sediment metagenome]|uniref:Lipoprotein n=1 Tax=marine sediment metagenome TaxID=412755 RepID=A0A0F9GLV5_9ZZZZ